MMDKRNSEAAMDAANPLKDLTRAQFAALDSGLVSGGGLETTDWLVLALVPVGAVVLAVYTARFTVLASLRKML